VVLITNSDSGVSTEWSDNSWSYHQGEPTLGSTDPFHLCQTE